MIADETLEDFAGMLQARLIENAREVGEAFDRDRYETGRTLHLDKVLDRDFFQITDRRSEFEDFLVAEIYGLLHVLRRLGIFKFLLEKDKGCAESIKEFARDDDSFVLAFVVEDVDFRAFRQWNAGQKEIEILVQAVTQAAFHILFCQFDSRLPRCCPRPLSYLISRETRRFKARAASNSASCLPLTFCMGLVSA